MRLDFEHLSPPRKHNPASPFDDVCDDGYRKVEEVEEKYNWKVHDFIAGVCILLVPLLFISWVVWELLYGS